MNTTRSFTRPLALLCLSFLCAVPAQAGRIEAVPGKRYSLTKQHGPWTIMVASLSGRDVDDEGVTEGKTAEEAADELVLELRKAGVPAYAFSLEKQLQSVRTPARGGQRQTRTVKAGGQICVLAGNYPSINSEGAVKTLQWVKRFKPKCLTGGAWAPTPGRPGPLSGAFLTVNPLLSPAEVAARQHSPEEIKLLRRLNGSNPYSLAKCRGTHSLVVARFSGKSVTTGAASPKQSVEDFVTDSLDKAGKEAWELCTVLKNEGVDAYLWHTRYESVVTVGTFDGPDDPATRRYRNQFGAVGTRRNPQTGQQEPAYKMRQVNGFGKNRNETRLWIFESEPTVMAVPRLR